ncbi:type II toxin-antitoxin system RelE/ParE family toxin (plasmid) [Escherichia albertii]|nr:type II toxin-antitoxin system RelE/ParE family toxin [Escherichia albertii]
MVIQPVAWPGSRIKVATVVWKVPGNWFIHPHFVLVYEVDSQREKVYILRVLHTAQKWP